MKVINETSDKYPSMKKFYIIYSAKFDEYQPNIIREGFVVVDFKKGRPPEMIGAMCFLVNSSSREYSSVWNLPADHGSQFDALLTGKGSSIVDQSAKNLVNKCKK
jgi:hypothetical protein